MSSWEIIKLIGHILLFILALPFWWVLVLLMFYSIKDLIRKIKELIRVIKEKDTNKE